MSDLPTLMAMYKPGMRLDSIVAMQDADDDDQLTGLKANLSSHKGAKLELPTIGDQPDEWHSRKVYFRDGQPDRIGIVVDEEYGVCDVKIYQGDEITNFSMNQENCHPKGEGMSETEIRITDDTPLVGFHGMGDGMGMTSLGLILLDASESVC